MPADRLLNTLLQHYQDVHDAAKTDQIFGTTVHLLTHLSNPLNLGVLTSQFLSAPAVWHRYDSDGLRTSLRVLSVYNTAASRVRAQESERRKHPERFTSGAGSEGGGLKFETWTRAVVKGADDRSRRWQHLLVLVGVLRGMEETGSHSLQNTLQQAVVTAANLALAHHREDGPAAAASVALALNFAFPLLSDFYKSEINCDELLPVAISCITGEYGYQDGQCLHAIGVDLESAPGGALSWRQLALSYHILQDIDKGPIVGSMGPLSRLVGFAAQHARDTTAVLWAQDTLLAFTGRVLEHWQQLPFSGLDPSQESAALSSETSQTTYSALLRFLQKLMFGLVAVLRAIVSRSLIDPAMIQQTAAPSIATKSLGILRNLYFITARDGNASFQAYAFTYLTSVDVLSRYPAAAETHLRDLRPANASSTIPSNHLERLFDLFYLNAAEHFTLALSTDACEALIIKPATAYLAYNGPMSPSMMELFESAHSAVLSVLACPQHSQLTIKMAPFYIVKLFDSFPLQISPRQFRVAFKTVMQIVSPPFPISAMEPQLSETLLEMLRDYMMRASPEILPAAQASASPNAVTQPTAGDEPMSAQSSLALALVDSLPFLPLPLMEDWLTTTAQALNEIQNPVLREPVKRRFIDMLVSGEMDVDRAAIGVGWWGTRGGRELVLHGASGEPPMMSGALVRDDQSRL